MTSNELHAIASKLQRDFEQDALTDRQMWFLEAVESELQYRHRATAAPRDRCWCWLCRPLDEWSTDSPIFLLDTATPLW